MYDTCCKRLKIYDPEKQNFGSANSEHRQSTCTETIQDSHGLSLHQHPFMKYWRKRHSSPQLYHDGANNRFIGQMEDYRYDCNFMKTNRYAANPWRLVKS